jgi:hypothetical protein
MLDFPTVEVHYSGRGRWESVVFPSYYGGGGEKEKVLIPRFYKSNKQLPYISCRTRELYILLCPMVKALLLEASAFIYFHY